jgi:hypothetical protein
MRHLRIWTAGHVLPAFIVAAVAALAVGCTSLPPAQSAKNVSTIAGEWRGAIQDRTGGSTGAAMTIAAEGRYELALDRPGPMGTKFPGTVTVDNGAYRFRSERTGNTGTMTLHEGDGKRVLSLRTDANTTTGEFTPVIR